MAPARIHVSKEALSRCRIAAQMPLRFQLILLLLRFFRVDVSKISNHHGVIHFIDDFLIAAPASGRGAKLVQLFGELCDELGVPLAVEKSEGPHSRIVLLGITLDSLAQTILLPARKLEQLLEFLD